MELEPRVFVASPSFPEPKSPGREGSLSKLGFTIFETPIGPCGLVWGSGGIVGVHLPEESLVASRARMSAQFPAALEESPPAEFRSAVEAIVALLEGARVDLTELRLDMTGVPPFHRRVYEVTRRIPPGDTRSYGEVAQLLDSPGAARAVGQALGRNPFALVVPCHRVLAAGGKMGGFTASGGVATKQRILSIERSASGAS